MTACLETCADGCKHSIALHQIRSQSITSFERSCAFSLKSCHLLQEHSLRFCLWTIMPTLTASCAKINASIHATIKCLILELP